MYHQNTSRLGFQSVIIAESVFSPAVRCPKCFIYTRYEVNLTTFKFVPPDAQTPSLTCISPWKNTTCLLLLFSFASGSLWPPLSGRSSSRSFTRLGSLPGTDSSFCSLSPGVPLCASKPGDSRSPGGFVHVVPAKEVMVLVAAVRMKPTETARATNMNSTTI